MHRNTNNYDYKSALWVQSVRTPSTLLTFKRWMSKMEGKEPEFEIPKEFLDGKQRRRLELNELANEAKKDLNIESPSAKINFRRNVQLPYIITTVAVGVAFHLRTKNTAYQKQV
jgi:hypothetical protein